MAFSVSPNRAVAQADTNIHILPSFFLTMFPLLIVLIIPLIVIAQTSPEVQDCPGRER